MEALTQRGLNARQFLLDMYLSMTSGPYSSTSSSISSTPSLESVSLPSIIQSLPVPNSIGMSSTRSSTPRAASVTSDLGPSIGEQTDTEETTDSNEEATDVTDSNSSKVDDIENSMKGEKLEQFHGVLYRWAVDKFTGEDKKFGFIRCSKLKREIFVHESNLANPDMPIPSRVVFCISEDMSKRKNAINVRLTKAKGRRSRSSYINQAPA